MILPATRVPSFNDNARHQKVNRKKKSRSSEFEIRKTDRRDETLPVHQRSSRHTFRVREMGAKAAATTDKKASGTTETAPKKRTLAKVALYATAASVAAYGALGLRPAVADKVAIQEKVRDVYRENRMMRSEGPSFSAFVYGIFKEEARRLLPS